MTLPCTLPSSAYPRLNWAIGALIVGARHAAEARGNCEDVSIVVGGGASATTYSP